MTAKYYSTPLVKVGNSSSIFTSNIYLSDASNVGSYGLELVVSGKPSNVSYSYTAANVAGFSVSAYSGVAGFSSSADVGGVFASTGVLIGSVTVTFATAPLALPKLVVLDTNLNLEDIAGVPIAVSYAEANNTLPSNALPIGLPLILGVVTENQTLTANTAGVSDADGLGALGYQWQRSANGTDWINIELATQVTYLLGDADAAKQVRVQVSYTDGGGTAEVVRSAATTVVNVNDLPTGSVTISGTAAQGQTLTASNTLADADGLGTISYQWSAAGTAINGATKATYLLTEAEVGKTLTVKASYTDLQGTAESVSSSATNVVSNALSGATVDIQAYSWKAHTLLDGVTVGLGNVSQVTGASGDAGSVSFTGVTDTAITLSATRTVPTAEAVATSAAVNLQDAIAILKMIVGLDVNGTGKALSPYQALAADYDGNGVVQLSDAIGVLKHVVGLSAPDPTWHFVNEIDSTVPAKANLAPGVAPPNISAALSGSSPVHVGLVGYLSGDVDGSFAGATGATALNTSYFTALVAAHSELGSSFNLAQFGVY